MEIKSLRQYFYWAKNQASGKIIEHRADEICESASTIKVLILTALFCEVEKGHLSLRQPLKIKKTHFSPNGSGILEDFYRVRPFTLYNLAFLMIIVSDNVATNAIIELLGKDKINTYCKSFGLKHTRLLMERLTFSDESSVDDPRIGETTPREMGEFIERVLAGKILDQRHTKLFKKFLSCTTSSFFGRKLSTPHTSPKPKIIEFGNKTGSYSYEKENWQFHSDCGFMKDKDGYYIFSVYSTGPTDKNMQYATDSTSRREFAAVSQKIYTELKKI